MYQTRHTFASNALAAGEAPNWVAKVLGHASPEMLFRVYARYIPNRTRPDDHAILGHKIRSVKDEKKQLTSTPVRPKYNPVAVYGQRNPEKPEA